ncbi:hypothetical protein F4859DRAFT_514066 [Xylaria cf. heliscus]|nr:hypothetical protein F4859DRAFT_514066 [Xylaria cf. heliscus]
MGNSFFAHSYITAYSALEDLEVLLVDGSIINANEKENADLWPRVRSGTDDLGLVTRFDMRTIEYADPSKNILNEVAPAAYDDYLAIGGTLLGKLGSRTRLNVTMEGNTAEDHQSAIIWSHREAF